MSDILAQLVLAARNNDGEGTGWMQMLVFAILAVFYVLGSIMKAKSSKDKEQEQPSRKPGFKPSEGGPKAFQKKTPYQQAQRPPYQPRPQVQPPRRKVVRPQPVGQRLAAKIEHAFQLPTIKPVEAPELSLPRPQLQPKLEEPQKPGPKFVKGLEDKGVGMPAEEIPQVKHLSEILSDYADPDELRRAILHYEILGKPLALRPPSDHIIGL